MVSITFNLPEKHNCEFQMHLLYYIIYVCDIWL